MALFFHEDPDFDPSVRQTGFYRYRQVLSDSGIHFFLVGCITLAGAIPLAAGITAAIMSSSVLVLLPASLAGGAIFGPFFAAMHDTVLRGLRDEFGHRWQNFRKAWRQNWRESLVPGALFGLFTGLYAFMAALFWWAETPPTPLTVALYLFSALLVLGATALYWPQLVLFRQTPLTRLRNLALFFLKYPIKVFWAAAGPLAYFALLFLLAPLSLIFVPIAGVWFIVFLSQFLLYDALNTELHIEEALAAAAPPEPAPPAEEESE